MIRFNIIILNTIKTMADNKDRRNAIKSILTGSVALGATPLLSSFKGDPQTNTTLKGNINHSVCQWTYGFLSVEELCKRVQKHAG